MGIIQNYCMLFWTNPGSRTSQNNNCTATYLPSYKRTKDSWRCWRNKCCIPRRSDNNTKCIFIYYKIVFLVVWIEGWEQLKSTSESDTIYKRTFLLRSASTRLAQDRLKTFNQLCLFFELLSRETDSGLNQSIHSSFFFFQRKVQSSDSVIVSSSCFFHETDTDHYNYWGLR